MSSPQTGMSDEEFERLKQEGKFKCKPSVPKKPSEPKRKLNLKGALLCYKIEEE